MDLDMEPGVDFVEQINEAVASCRLLIAVLGPRWATVQDADGRRRLDDPADFIRVEIEAGLRREDVRVVPVLVHGARMPRAEELPPELADLARRNALELSDARWSYDVDRLASTADRLLVRAPGTHQPADMPVGEPTDVPVKDNSRTGPARPGWLRRYRRPAIAALMLAALVGVVAVIVAGGGDDGGSSESRLSEVIPASVQKSCRRVHGDAFWMKNAGAVEQQVCELPSRVLSEAIQGGNLAYGLFPSASKARDFVENDFRDALSQKSKMPNVCDGEATAQLEADYPGGNAECYENEDGVVINWSYPESGVAVQLYFDLGTEVQAAVEARAKLL
jgi:hypothetical protein